MPSNDGASLAILKGIRGWWPWPTGGRGIGAIIGAPGGPGIGGPRTGGPGMGGPGTGGPVKLMPRGGVAGVRRSCTGG
jgi:hypothetical protein